MTGQRGHGYGQRCLVIKDMGVLFLALKIVSQAYPAVVTGRERDWL